MSGCRWFVSESHLGPDAQQCGKATAPNRPYCDEHCAKAFLPNEPKKRQRSVRKAKAVMDYSGFA